MLEDDPVKEAAYQRFKSQIALEEKALRERSSNNERVSVAVPPAEMRDRAERLRVALADSVEARLQMQTYLDNLIDVILMNPEDRTATVVMANGLLVFKLDAGGKLIGSADSLLMRQKRTYMMPDGSKQTFDPRKDDRDPTEDAITERITASIGKGMFRPAADADEQHWRQGT